jgi:hypothetical protein
MLFCLFLYWVASLYAAIWYDIEIQKTDINARTLFAYVLLGWIILPFMAVVFWCDEISHKTVIKKRSNRNER